MKKHDHRAGGFTLLELLVVITILAVLAGLGMTVVSRSRRAANQAREISAGRQLMAAVIRAATDDNGDLPAAYTASDETEAQNEEGQQLVGPAAQRYPWRLCPYLDNRIFGTLVVNDQAELAREADRGLRDYLVSFAPTFGMNATYVGGNFKSSLAPGGLAERKFGKFCVRNINEPVSPERLIVFASARYTGAEKRSFLGHHIVQAPNETRMVWSTTDYDEDDDAQRLGYIHPRHQGRAVVIMFDGHAELLTPAQLLDMRYWSNQAAARNDASYVIGKK